ncbi:MAG: hypothetical protein QOJ63_1497, partial [Solirubrobacteraceae bacterium]|nr:hypothetical protein [Solirubrobacteraceae bacterium]
AGTGAVPGRVSPINSTLTAAESDANTINGGLTDVNKHLTSICKSTLLNVLGPLC